MNRRTFLLSLPFVPAAAYAAARSLPIDGVEPGCEALLEQSRRIGSITDAVWLTTTRKTGAYSLEYLDALDAIFEPDPVVRSRNWHERRRTRFRESLARQLAMPAPRLP